ncbi:hypothetical protein [Vibrio harveyi]|uniref:hypothetical protein n=1 Tax=Vibrio harveyi TaxID=669 RepID=UPI000841854C|nr:hypothetical protein [Vibrio harveyi]ODM56015.1 hypothetical protein BC455_22725 [Vibrio harveyi]
MNVLTKILGIISPVTEALLKPVLTGIVKVNSRSWSRYVCGFIVFSLFVCSLKFFEGAYIDKTSVDIANNFAKQEFEHKKNMYNSTVENLTYCISSEDKPSKGHVCRLAQRYPEKILNTIDMRSVNRYKGDLEYLLLVLKSRKIDVYKAPVEKKTGYSKYLPKKATSLVDSMVKSSGRYLMTLLALTLFFSFAYSTFRSDRLKAWYDARLDNSQVGS